MKRTGKVRWVRMAVALLVAFGAMAGAAVLYLHPRTEHFFTDGSTVWPADDDRLAVRTILWEAGAPLPSPVNSDQPDYQPRLAPDGTELYFTRGQAGRNAQIYVSRRAAGGWSEPVPLADVNTGHDEIGPAISLDGHRLVFYSNRPGGTGGYDLYESRRGEHGWEKPTNLGPEVNSTANEYDPAFSADGATLLFSSNRRSLPPDGRDWPATLRHRHRPTQYDLFAADVSGPAPANVRSLDAANTEHNEGQPVLSLDGDFLYFSSDRPGGQGGFDLWRARLADPDLQTFGKAENLGTPLNTPFNEMDPAISLEGFGLYFSSDRVKPGEPPTTQPVARAPARPTTQPADEAARPADYDLYYARSREVIPFTVTTRKDVGKIWASVSWPLVLLVLAILMMALMAMLFVNFRRWPPVLITCLLISLMLHLMGLTAASYYWIHQRLMNLEREQTATKVEVSLAELAGAQLTARLRSQISRLREQPADLSAAERMAAREQMPAPKQVRAESTPLAAADLEPMQPRPLQMTELKTPEAPRLLDQPVRRMDQSEPRIEPVPLAPQHADVPRPAQRSDQQIAPADVQVARQTNVVALVQPAEQTMRPAQPTPASVRPSPARPAPPRRVKPPPTARPEVAELELAAVTVPSPPVVQPIEPRLFPGPTPQGAPTKPASDSPASTPQTASVVVSRAVVSERKPARPTDTPTVAVPSASPAPTPDPTLSLDKPLASSRPLRPAPEAEPVVLHQPKIQPLVDVAPPAPPATPASPAAAKQPDALPDSTRQPVALALERPKTPEVAAPVGHGLPIPVLPGPAKPTQQPAALPGQVVASMGVVNPSIPDQVIRAAVGPAPAVAAEAVVLSPAAPSARTRAPAAAPKRQGRPPVAADLSGPAKPGTATAARQPSPAPSGPTTQPPQATSPTQGQPVALADRLLSPTPSSPAPAATAKPTLTSPTVAALPIQQPSAPAGPTPAGPKTAGPDQLPPPTALAGSIKPPDTVARAPGARPPGPASEPPRPATPVSVGPVRLAGLTTVRPPRGPTAPAEPLAPPPAPTPALTALPVKLSADKPLEQAPAEMVYKLRKRADKESIIEQLGGSKQTEKAVREALAFLNRCQERDGSWDADGFVRHLGSGGRRLGGAASRRGEDVGVSGLALLAFLGAGHTHTDDGPYKGSVARAIGYLVKGMRPDGDLRRGGQMYSQGIGAMALCEAFALTGDPTLKGPARRSVQFILNAQTPGAGWRYIPGRDTDTSVLGWELMAIKSGQIAGLAFDVRKAWAGSEKWLARVGKGRRGGIYVYQPRHSTTSRNCWAMTAEGLFCRQILGSRPNANRRAESVRFLLDHLPKKVPTGRSRGSYYYWYYATLAMHQEGGAAWEQWNAAMRPFLTRLQRQDGPAKGSWDLYGNYDSAGGRIYTTALGAMTLEVYYRFLPFYKAQLPGR